MKSVNVSLGKRSYKIIIKKGILRLTGKIISDLPVRRTATIITNTTVAPLYLEIVKKSLKESSFLVNDIIIPDGEKYKNLSTADKIYKKLLCLSLDRNSPLIALGGGVVGDITGFISSTFLRGIPFIQIPTTILAQVDSSVGGKTGVNLPGGKNMVGTFYQPSIVIIDPYVLKTLDPGELKAGMSEVIKYGIISNRKFFSFLLKNILKAEKLHWPTIIHIIKTCCLIKSEITSKDETEKGVRSFLNFGHTVGHAVETLTRYREYKHGEAVSIGMAVAARLSFIWGYCSFEDYKNVLLLLEKTGLPADIPEFTSSKYINIIQKDKKKSGDTIRMVIMKKIGDVVLQSIERDKLKSTLKKEFHLR